MRISIHALLAESDNICRIRSVLFTIFLSTLSLRRATNNINGSVTTADISIHALLAESDGGSGVGSWPRVIFLSTLSLRRATRDTLHTILGGYYFYPRSPCGERLISMLNSPHSKEFLSTLSLRRATSRPRRLKSRR